MAGRAKELRPLNPKHHLTPALLPHFMAERGMASGVRLFDVRFES
jgi:hypothetical protein